jgi:hypothetical protein
MAKRIPTQRANDRPVRPPSSQREEAASRAGSISMASGGSEPSEEEIRQRAYDLYLQRGGADGLDFDDWLSAEQELKKKR